MNAMNQDTVDIDATALLTALGIARPQRPADADPSPYSDSSLSEKLVEEIMRDRFKWTVAAGWHQWTGAIWGRQPAEAAAETVRQYLRTVAAQVAATGDAEDMRKAARLLSAKTVEAVMKLVRGQIIANLEDFDQDPDLLVTPSGVIDFRTGTLLEHDPTRLVTKMTTVEYRPDARHPDWDMALEAVPEDLREWLQLRLGQAITGHAPDDDVLPILQGGGQNGKSVILGAVLEVLGTYAQVVPDSLLLASDNHPTDAMTLRGLRLGVIEELPEGRRLATEAIKKLIGTPDITARYMRRDFVTFKATHSLMVSSNFKPEVSETDHGTWRRLALVTFPYRYLRHGDSLIGPQDRTGDPGLRQRLRSDPAAQEAVLAWLVQGARAWYRLGQSMPPLPSRVRRDTWSWRQEQDAVLGYAAERLVPDADSVIWTQDLREDLAEWLSARGQRPWADRTVAQRLGGHSWASEHRVERAKARHRRDAVSRPRVTGFGLLPLPTNPYWGWTGVRFRAESDPDYEDVPTR